MYIQINTYARIIQKRRHRHRQTHKHKHRGTYKAYTDTLYTERFVNIATHI